MEGKGLSERKGARRTLGFFFYDVLHIAAALAMIIYLAVAWSQAEIPSMRIFDMVAEFFSLLFSALLLVYIRFLYLPADAEAEKGRYALAWAILSFSLLFPALTVSASYAYHRVDAPSGVISSLIFQTLGVLFPVLAALLFGMAIAASKKEKVWKSLLVLGISMIVLASLANNFALACDIYENLLEFHWTMVIKFLVFLAPLLPAAVSLLDLFTQEA